MAVLFTQTSRARCWCVTAKMADDRLSIGDINDETQLHQMVRCELFIAYISTTTRPTTTTNVKI